MKIDQQARQAGVTATSRDAVALRAAAVDGFATLLDSAVARREEDELEQLFGDVAQYGEQLIAQGSLEAALGYRKAVKRLIERVVSQGLHTTNALAVDRTGRRKQFLTVDEIDKRLLELAEGIMQRQQEPLDLLRLVGEIKGLLISLRL